MTSTFQNIKVSKLFNEYFVTIQLTLIFANLLLKLDHHKRALQVYEWLRDLCEDTQNNKFLL